MRITVLLFTLLAFSCGSNPKLSSGPFNIEETEAWKKYDTGRFFIIYPDLSLDQDTLTIGEPITGHVFLAQDEMFKAIANELHLNYSRTYGHFEFHKLEEQVEIANDLDTLIFEVYPNKPRRTDTITNECFAITVRLENLTHSYDSIFSKAKRVFWKSNGK